MTPTPRQGGHHHGTRFRPQVAARGGGGGLDADTLRGVLAASRRLHTEALRRVEAFLTAHSPAYVAWSGGKDSTVVADLATRVDPDIVLAHFDTGFDFPETLDHQDRLAAERGWNLRRYRCGNALEEMIRTGAWDHEAPDLTIDGGDSEWLHVTRLGPAAMAAADTRANGWLWGLRASEAKRRLALLGRTRGVYQRADGMWACSPIWDWRDRDIYAYHAATGLPLSPLYAKLEALGCPRSSQRTSLIIDPGGLRHGRAVWLKRGWPDLWTRLTAVLPRLKEDA